MDAVLVNPNSTQMAGKVTHTAGRTVKVTLGPFSKRARLVLRYKTKQLYTYQAMSVDGSSDIGAQWLCPLLVALPFAGQSHYLRILAVSVGAGGCVTILSQDKDKEAYGHLKNQNLLQPMMLLAVANLALQSDNCIGFTFRCNSLPPWSFGILAWMALPNPPDDEDDYVDLGCCLGKLCVD